VLRGASAKHVLQRLIQLSGEHGSRFSVGDFRATLDLPWSREELRVDGACREGV
jgi:hypothetical protein